MVTESHIISARRTKHFSQLLNIHGVNEVKQTEKHKSEPLVPGPSVFEVELAIEKLKCQTSPGIDQIPTELITAGGLLYLFGIRR